MPGGIAWHCGRLQGWAPLGRGVGQEAFFQVTENPVPALFSAPGSALVAPELSIMVISSSVNEEMLPAVLPSVTAALEAVQVPKFDSGSTPLDPVGASAIHSALLSTQLEAEQVCVVVKLLAVWVESVTVSL